MKKTILIVGAVMAVSSMAFAKNAVWVTNDTTSNVTVSDTWYGSDNGGNRITDTPQTINPSQTFAFKEYASSTYGSSTHNFHDELNFTFVMNNTQLMEYGQFEFTAGYHNGYLAHSNLDQGELLGSPLSQSTPYTLVLKDGTPSQTNLYGSQQLNQEINCSDDTNMTLIIQPLSSTPSTTMSFLKKLL